MAYLFDYYFNMDRSDTALSKPTLLKTQEPNSPLISTQPSTPKVEFQSLEIETKIEQNTQPHHHHYGHYKFKNLPTFHYPIYNTKIIPFKLWFSSKERIYVHISINDDMAVIGVYSFFTIPTILYYTLILPFFSHEVVLPTSIISGIIFSLVLLFHFDVMTTSPGYADTTNTITQEEYDKLKPKVTVKNYDYPLSYCETCHIVREIRMFHCSMCNKCIIRHDHHCPFVNNCIGKNNHFKFLKLIITATTHSTFITIYCILFLWYRIHSFHDFYNAKNIICCLLVGTGVVLAFMMIPFIIRHIFLISYNITSNDFYRHKYSVNAFDKGCVNNWKEVLFKENVI